MYKIFNQYFSVKVIFLMLTEAALISAFLLASIHIRYSGNLFLADELTADPLFPARVAVLVILCQVCFYYNSLYDLPTVCRRSELAIRLLQAVGVLCILVTVVYLLYPPMFLENGVLVITAFLILVGVIAWREGVSRIGIPFTSRERILILGTGQVGIEVCRWLLKRNDLNFEIVGFLDEDQDRVGETLVNPSIIGTIANLRDIVARERIHRVVVSLPDRRGRLPVKDLLQLRMRGVAVEDAHNLYECVAGRIALESVNPSWLIFSEGFRKFHWQLILKRCLDVLLASVGFLLSLPIMAVVAICIKLDSKGPVLFRQERVGQFGRLFTLLKFRSMALGAEAEGIPQWASENDPRATKVGRIIRRFRLDELPQFINILAGDMSFVGPRPERPFFVETLSKHLRYYSLRHVVRPGLTGWAQVKSSYAASEDETRTKLEYDFFYIKNYSVLFDLAVVLETIKMILFGRGAR